MGTLSAIQFWKCSLIVDGVKYVKHLNCISVSFATSQLCAQCFEKVMLGLTDFSAIGQGVVLSMDSHKHLAHKYYQQHVDKLNAIRKSVLDKESKCKLKNESAQEKELNGGSMYLLPTPMAPLQSFVRPNIVKKEEYKQQNVVALNTPAIKKRKLIKTEKKMTHLIVTPKSGRSLKSSQEILNLVGKIDKKKKIEKVSPKFIDFRKNKIAKKKEHKTAVIVQSKKKLVLHSNLLKNSMIKVKTSKHCKAEKITIPSPILKSKKRKHSDFANTNAASTQVIKKAKVISVNSRVKNVSIAPSKKEKVAQLSPPHKKKKKKKKKQKQTIKIEESWRDYLHLYDGKEYFAQLHFKCMHSFKLQVISQCADEQRKRVSKSMHEHCANNDN